MSEPFIGEIKMVGFNFNPRGWTFCDGQLLSISQHTALFSLLGTTFGGDGRTTFGIPALRGRTPIGVGQQPGGTNFRWGQKSGAESVALTSAQIPGHTHPLNMVVDNADSVVPTGNTPGRGRVPIFTSDGAFSNAMRSGTIGTNSGGQGHDNMQPYLVLNFVIALVGIYPSRN